MKKLFFTFFLSSSLMVHAQGVGQGKIIIDGNYGWPNVLTILAPGLILMNPVDTNATVLDIEASGLGPVHARVLYMLNDRFDIGGEINISNTSVTWLEDSYSYASPIGYKASLDRLRIMIRFDYHYTEPGNLMDLYGGVAVGYKRRTLKTESSNTTWGGANIPNATILPVSFRLVPIGLRYFFAENIGVNIEVGLGGGGLLVFGLSGAF